MASLHEVYTSEGLDGVNEHTVNFYHRVNPTRQRVMRQDVNKILCVRELEISGRILSISFCYFLCSHVPFLNIIFANYVSSDSELGSYNRQLSAILGNMFPGSNIVPPEIQYTWTLSQLVINAIYSILLALFFPPGWNSKSHVIALYLIYILFTILTNTLVKAMRERLQELKRIRATALEEIEQ